MNTVSALVFAVLALVLAGPVPTALSRARWPYRAPRAALVLWQAIAIAAVLSAFSSGLAIASRLLVLGPDGRPTTAPTEEIAALGLPLWLAAVVVLALTLLVGAKLIYSIVLVGVHTRRRRARHRMLVDLLDRSTSDHAPPGKADVRATELRVLDAAEPVAYCLPGIRRRIVLSEGTFASLGDDEITAILSHERAHLRARHDLVLEAFGAVHQAFPRIVRSRTALGSVRLLVELLADDSARRVTGAPPLARALVTCANSTAPAGALAAGGPTTLLRVQRLGAGGNDARTAAAAYAASAAILVVPTIAVAMPWLVELQRLLHY